MSMPLGDPRRMRNGIQQAALQQLLLAEGLLQALALIDGADHGKQGDGIAVLVKVVGNLKIFDPCLFVIFLPILEIVCSSGFEDVQHLSEPVSRPSIIHDLRTEQSQKKKKKKKKKKKDLIQGVAIAIIAAGWPGLMERSSMKKIMGAPGLLWMVGCASDNNGGERYP